MVEKTEHNEESSPPEWIRQDDPAGALAKDIMAIRTGGTIRIWCCEAPPDIYSDQRVLTAFREAKREKRATILVIAAPVLVTNESGTNGLLQLQEEGVVDGIHYLPDQGAVSRFYVITAEQENISSKELPIDILSEYPRYVQNPDYHSRRDRRRIAEGNTLLFDGMFSELGKTQWLSQPFLVNKANFRILAQAAERTNTPYKFCTISDLQSLLPNAPQMLRPYTPSRQVPQQ